MMRLTGCVVGRASFAPGDARSPLGADVAAPAGCTLARPPGPPTLVRRVMVCHSGTSVRADANSASKPNGRAPGDTGGNSIAGVAPDAPPGPVTPAAAGVPVSREITLPPQRNEVGTAVSVRIINTGAVQNPIVLCQLKSRALPVVFWRNQTMGRNARHDHARGIHK